MAEKRKFVDLTGLTRYDEKIKEYIGKQVTAPDWDAVEGTKGGIKNKPFGEVFTEFYGASIAKYNSFQNNRYVTTLPNVIPTKWKEKLVEGAYIKIKLGDKEKVYQAVSNSMGMGLNLTMTSGMWFFTVDNGEDAIGVLLNGGGAVRMDTNFDPSGMALRISSIEEKKIEEKWLPDSVASKEYVDEKVGAIKIPAPKIPTPDWEASVGEDGFIKNKPFGENLPVDIINVTPEMVDLNDHGLYQAAFAAHNADILKTGTLYLVKWGEEEFETICTYNGDGFELAMPNGRGAILLQKIEGNPCIIILAHEDFIDTNIRVCEYALKRMDARYLPENTATKEYVEKNVESVKNPYTNVIFDLATLLLWSEEIEDENGKIEKGQMAFYLNKDDANMTQKEKMLLDIFTNAVPPYIMVRVQEYEYTSRWLIPLFLSDKGSLMNPLYSNNIGSRNIDFSVSRYSEGDFKCSFEIYK